MVKTEEVVHWSQHYYSEGDSELTSIWYLEG